MMNRRTALKNLTLSIGYVVSVPTIMSTLSSCNEKVATWQPLFLSEQEKFMVTHLVDIILPTSDIPGGLDVNIPKFMDKMYQEIELESNQKAFRQGGEIFAIKFGDRYGKKIMKGNKNEIQDLFAHYFVISKEETDKVLQEQRKSQNEIHANNLNNYLLYKFLFSIRYYSLFGYFTSEKVGKEVLAYDPIPGVYKGCISLDEATKGKAWTL
jgi:hypothetical protein